MSSFLDCHVTLMNQLETLGTGTWSTYDEAGALRDWAIIIPSAYPRSSPLPYAGIRSRRCWRLAAPTGSASGMGVTDLDLDPVSRMSESSGSYARVFCMLATASGSPKRTANHGRPVRIAAEISHLIASFRLVGPRIWMGPAFGRRPIPPLSHRDRERPRQWLCRRRHGGRSQARRDRRVPHPCISSAPTRQDRATSSTPSGSHRSIV
jgi:hypothetical protein